MTRICLAGGSVLTGASVLDDEMDYYIQVLTEIGKNFREHRFPRQLITTALDHRLVCDARRL